ncbi:hypothetical protein EDB84DRAFT_1434708 [Lactarius hengduanensis]|nr:hypothetical protein EDB84DRAFT_1434708 [Lactarius hengduanensis]
MCLYPLSVLFIIAIELRGRTAFARWDDVKVKHTWNSVLENWQNLGRPPTGTTSVLRGLLAQRLSNGSGKFTPSSGGKAAHPMEWTTVTDPMPLWAVPKVVQLVSRQLPSDSHQLWESATSKLLSKEYGEVTRVKTRRPTGNDAVSTLTQAGREVLEAEIKYEHVDKNKDGVERDNGGAPAS